MRVPHGRECPEVDATRITVTRRDRKVSVRLSGMPTASTEGVCITAEEAQCAANAIIRLPKDNRKCTLRFGALRIHHFPDHHQPVEIRFADADWSVIVDLTRIESYTVADMLRGAGVSDRPFDGETDLQFVPRIQDHRRIVLPPLPASITSLLDSGPGRLNAMESDDPADQRPARPATRPKRSAADRDPTN